MQMTTEQVQIRVYQIIRQEFDLTPTEEIRDDHRLADDLGADSIDVVELAMACEEEFGLEDLDFYKEPNPTVSNVIDEVVRLLRL